VAELIVTTGPIDQVGWASASLVVTLLKSFRALNGPPLAVSITRATSLVRPACMAWNSAECSESTGMIRSLPCAITKSPPATSDSLFASATLFPASSAESVGLKPIDPVIPFSTTSACSAAISLAAFGPSITVHFGSASFSATPSPEVPTTGTSNLRTCSINKLRLFSPADSPTTRNLSGF